MNTIRILLAEDQTLVRDALCQLLDLQPQLTVVAAVANGIEAQQALAELEVDLVLTDLEMPHGDGLGLCQWVAEHKPRVPLVVLTTYNRAGYLKRAAKAGARGFILKDVAVDELVATIVKVHRGETCFDLSLVIAGLAEEDPLTDREKQVLRLTETGLSTGDMAAHMCLSRGTVRNYLSEAISKLYATTRFEAARVAREKGWL